MQPTGRPHKHSRRLYPFVGAFGLHSGGVCLVLGLALCMFIGLFAFGHDLLGWSDPNGQVQLGLFMAFLFGIVCGYRTRD
jgi:hypothetical protein